LPEGFTTEIRPLLPGWIESLCATLVSGDILLIDYGMSRREYFHPQRDAGTLMCHYRHRAHGNPFIYPGLQDITAWVDFSDCADAAQAAGMHLAGYATQGSWIAESLHGDPAVAQTMDVAQAARLRTLVLPGEMGERFKALLLARSADPQAAAALRGRDLRSRL
jgi:SAM-dependent MidA family methyltransferase